MEIGRIKILAESQGGIVKTADFNGLGLHNKDVVELEHQGILRRIRHGYYQLADQDHLEDEVLIASFFPDGILCMESALYLYGYVSRLPLAWSLAFSRTVSRSRLQHPVLPVKAYYVKDELYQLGSSKITINQTELPIYDRDKLICDCIKYRHKLDPDLFSQAIRAYVSDCNKNIANLTAYARRLRIYHKLMDIIGAWL